MPGSLVGIGDGVGDEERGCQQEQRNLGSAFPALELRHGSMMAGALIAVPFGSMTFMGNGHVDALLEVMPAEHGQDDGYSWAAVETALGHRLPSDYKAFMEVYGAGSLPGLSVEPPVRPDDYPYRNGGIEEGTGDLRLTFENLWPGDPVPEGLDRADQLVGWGFGHDDPDLYGWIMTGKEPDEWPVVVWRRHQHPEFVRFDLGMVEFLRRLVTADLDECPGSNDAAWGNRGPYIGWREQLRRREAGLDERTGRPQPDVTTGSWDMPEVRPLPEWLAWSLSEQETPVRLAVHLRLVHDVAVSLLDGLAETFPELKVDRHAVEFGAATHDIGKIVHRSELTGPGSEHEETGRQMLLRMGHGEHLSRFAGTHGTWDVPDRQLEDLLVTLADKVWKGKRISGLEERIAELISGLTEKDRWEAFLIVDQLCEDLAASADTRLAFHAAAAVDVGPNGPLDFQD